MSARSTSAPIAATLGWQRSPITSLAAGLTGYIGPLNPARCKLATSMPPILSRERDAPITATDRGWSSLRILSPAAVQLRNSLAWREASVSPVGKLR